jgi:hypothetical protein
VTARARVPADALDLATGTGGIAFTGGFGWNVIGLDVTRRMIELARRGGAAGGRPCFWSATCSRCVSSQIVRRCDSRLRPDLRRRRRDHRVLQQAGRYRST